MFHWLCILPECP